MPPLIRNSEPVPRANRYSILLIASLLAGCATSSREHSDSLGSTPDISFKQFEIATRSAARQTVLTGSFMGNPSKDLAVVYVNADGERSVRIYAFGDDSWNLVIDEPLSRDVQFVDVVAIDGHDRLLTYRHSQVSWFDFDSAIEHKLIEVDFEFSEQTGEKVPHIDITLDINGDGLDDLVLPDFDGFWISTQSENGSFADSVKLGPEEPFIDEIALEDKVSYRETGFTSKTIPQYLSRVHNFDNNHDGLLDLVFWNVDHFDVHLQNSDGTFDPNATTFSTDVWFVSDGVYSHMFGFADESASSLLFGSGDGNKRTVLHSFVDVNDDGVVDIATHTMEGQSLLKMRTLLAVHFGEFSGNELRFPAEPSAMFGPIGSQPMGYAEQRFEDLDGDGQLEVALVNVDAGVADMFQVMLANSIDIDVHVFGAENGSYQAKPAYSRRLKTADKIFGKRDPFFPPVLGGDVNGDGYADLIVGRSRNELRIYAGTPAGKLFVDEPVSVDVELPGDERKVRLVDINNDGKQDALIELRSKEDAHRVIILVSQ